MTRPPHRASPIAAPGRVLAVLVLAGALGGALVGCGEEERAAQSAQKREPAVTPDASSPSMSPGGSPTGSAAVSPSARRSGAAVPSGPGGLPPCPASGDLPAVSGGLPRLTFDCLGDGPRVTLSGLRGRPMVVNVWASWCPPCGQEMPLLVQASQAAGDRVLFLGIDIQNTREQGLAWAADAGMNFPSVYDPDGEVKAPLRLLGPPVTFFVRPDGTIAYTHQGQLRSIGQLADLIGSHLGVRL